MEPIARQQELERLHEEVVRVIRFEQPYLSAKIGDNEVVVEGMFLVKSRSEAGKSGGPIASFQARLEFPAGYPNEEPRVFETGGRIPQERDFHVNPDGSCCIGVWEAWLIRSADTSVASFFDDPLWSYFFGQAQFERLGTWPFGEEEHGEPGRVDALREARGWKN